MLNDLERGDGIDELLLIEALDHGLDNLEATTPQCGGQSGCWLESQKFVETVDAPYLLETPDLVLTRLEAAGPDLPAALLADATGATHVEGADDAGDPFTIDAARELRVRVSGADGELLPARVYLESADGRSYFPDTSFPRVVSVTEDYYFHTDGSFTVTLPAGEAELEVWRGFEYEPVERTVDIRAGEWTTVEVELDRWVDAVRAAGGRVVQVSPHRMTLEDFFISYGQQDLRSGEFVEQVLLPIAPENQLFASYKISKRIEQDISAVCAAFAVRISDGVIQQARVCFGGMAATPKRAKSCEKALNGQPWDQETITSAMAALVHDFTPLTDMRASEDYRMLVSQNLLQRFYLEHTDTPYPVQLGLRYVTDLKDLGAADV